MYSREINGQPITLSASGWTYLRTFVLYDYETESIWYHFLGSRGLTCVSGKYVGEFLPERYSKRVRWNDWVQERPDTKIMWCKKIGFMCAGAGEG